MVICENPIQTQLQKLGKNGRAYKKVEWWYPSFPFNHGLEKPVWIATPFIKIPEVLVITNYI